MVCQSERVPGCTRSLCFRPFRETILFPPGVFGFTTIGPVGSQLRGCATALFQNGHVSPLRELEFDLTRGGKIAQPALGEGGKLRQTQALVYTTVLLRLSREIG